MATTELQEHIGISEPEIHEVRSVPRLADDTQQPWWVRFSGTFKDDPLFDEIAEAGQAYRRSLVPRAR